MPTSILSPDITYDFIALRYPEVRAFNETYGFSGNQGMVNIDGLLMRPKGRASDTLLVFMHPAVTQHGLPVPQSLVLRGFHVLCANNRYVKNDTTAILEKVLLDLGAHIRHAREKFGYRRIVLCGWSGGGSLMTFYQSQAENPTITDTPAGDPVDVKGAGLIPADAVIFQAAAISRARILLDSLDPSVLDEADPDRRDAALDIYDPANPHQPPYSAEYIAEFRKLQLARMRRITAWVKQTLADLKQRGTGEVERGFVTHRTFADPRFMDPTLDPNDRKPRWSFVGNPETANNGPTGLGRYSSLRSWLSQWSIDDTRGDGAACARQITVPFLAIENSADDAAPPPHTITVYREVASKVKQMVLIKGANHYYAGQPEQLAAANDALAGFLAANGLWSG